MQMKGWKVSRMSAEAAIVAVPVIVWVGLFIYMFLIDRRIRRIMK
jgi:CcmD family protein